MRSKDGEGEPAFPQRRAFAESGAANAVFLYDPSRENSVWSAPQSATNAKFKIIFPLNMASNDDDRRQRRKQGAVVGAAVSKTRVPPKARSGCWVPQPVVKGCTPLTILKKWAAPEKTEDSRLFGVKIF